MFWRSCISRLPLLLATAIVAAALGDACVETIANSGVIGRGYADNNHLSIVPALVAGACLLLLVIVVRSIHLLRRTRTRTSLPPRSTLFNAACVFALQLTALFVMESVERIAYGGNVSFGSAWLGGPVWFSLPAHAALAYTCTQAAARFTRSAAHRCAALVVSALRSFFPAGAPGALLTPHRSDAAFLFAERFCVRNTGERAPPFLPAPI
jgi:hypothetical protein